MSRIIFTALAVVVLAGCTSTPPLEARPAGNPLQVDLSGNWVLRGGAAPLPTGEQTIRIPRAVSRNPQPVEQPRTRRSRNRGGSLYVFLESGRSLKVTQTDYGLFFSFDRAIVEEYNFGENRRVNVGPIAAQRVSGWEGDAFVAETQDEDGYILTETWRLDEGGRELLRDISIAREGRVAYEARQVFVPE